MIVTRPKSVCNIPPVELRGKPAYRRKATIMARNPQGDSANLETAETPQNQKEGNPVANSDDIWAEQPDTPLIPFLSNQQRAQLVNDRAVLKLTGMDYESTGMYGPKFVATFIVPSGDAYNLSFTVKSIKSPSPRDITNKWLWTLVNEKKQSGIPVQLVKRGRAYMLAKPGSESDFDVSGLEGSPVTTGNLPDIPDF
jgi:hypothetical protein